MFKNSLDSLKLGFIIIFALAMPHSISLNAKDEIGHYEITVLATNISNYGGFGEWSFSALYESKQESILFDTDFKACDMHLVAPSPDG